MNNPQYNHETDRLENWNDIKSRCNWDGLLIGNGASCNIWEHFRYPSLYQVATENIGQPLSRAARNIFNAMKTSNFEIVLASLTTTEVVCQACNENHQFIAQHYADIQRALIDAVHHVHLAFSNLPPVILGKIRSALMPYRSIYSTNYDLLLYWAIMYENPPSHKDYFWSLHDSRSFDITNTEIFGESRSRVLFLHGALHLVRNTFNGCTKKRVSDDGALLSQFGRNLASDDLPLFITEGTAEDKLAAIRRSDYLSFAYEQFANHRSNLVIFGHSLGESDQHLIDAMKSWRNYTIAISMRPNSNDPLQVIERKVALRRLLPDAQILFFDAETHPLGEPSLRIPAIGDNNR